jgi:3-oxoacyl-[acyl-carrier protein] reductase
MKPFEGRVALVVGGGRGIGAATARLLAEQGATVALSYVRNAQTAQALGQSIRERGGKVAIYQSDVHDAEQVDKLVQSACDLEGHLDIVVQSAPGQGYIRPFLSLAWQDFVLPAQSKLKACYEIGRAVLPIMRRQHSGHLVIVTSGWARNPSMPGLASLAPAFGAEVSLAKALAQEFGPDGITVNAVAPGMVDTDLSSQMPPEVRAAVIANTPLRRIATPEDIARVIVFLAGEASGFMTGTYVPVNGGIVMD